MGRRAASISAIPAKSLTENGTSFDPMTCFSLRESLPAESAALVACDRHIEAQVAQGAALRLLQMGMFSRLTSQHFLHRAATELAEVELGSKMQRPIRSSRLVHEGGQVGTRFTRSVDSVS